MIRGPGGSHSKDRPRVWPHAGLRLRGSGASAGVELPLQPARMQTSAPPRWTRYFTALLRMKAGSAVLPARAATTAPTSLWWPSPARSVGSVPRRHQRKVLATAAHLMDHPLLPIAHRNVVLALPKLFRPMFLRDRGLLKRLPPSPSKILRHLNRCCGPARFAPARTPPPASLKEPNPSGHCEIPHLRPRRHTGSGVRLL